MKKNSTEPELPSTPHNAKHQSRQVRKKNGNRAANKKSDNR